MSETYRQRIRRTQNEAQQRKARRPRHWVSEYGVSNSEQIDGEDFTNRVILPLEASTFAKARKGQVVQRDALKLPPIGAEVYRSEYLPSGARLIVASRYDIVDGIRMIARVDAVFAHV